MTTSLSSPLRVQCGGGQRPGSLASDPRGCSTSEAFSTRTVLTENICRCVQQILQHRPATMPFLHGPESEHKNGIVKRNIRSHIHSCSPMRTPKANEEQVFNSPNMTPSLTGPFPVQCTGGRRPGSLADAPQNCSTSEAFSVLGQY